MNIYIYIKTTAELGIINGRSHSSDEQQSVMRVAGSHFGSASSVSLLLLPCLFLSSIGMINKKYTCPSQSHDRPCYSIMAFFFSWLYLGMQPKLNINWLKWASVSLFLDKYPKEMRAHCPHSEMYKNVPGSYISDSLKLGTIQMSLNINSRASR